MTSELSRVESLPIRTPGATTDESPSSSAPALRLTCPSCSAELTSMVDHAATPAQDDKVPSLTWTTDARVLDATLKALRASAATAPGVEAPPQGEDPCPSPQTSHLRLVPPPLHAVHAVEAPQPRVDATAPTRPGPNEQPTARVVESTNGQATAGTTNDARAANRSQELPTRRRRQGFFSRVLTVRTFRVDRDVARGARDHDAAVTALLDGATSGILSLHHHRLAGRRADVAHVSIGASGIFVIDVRQLNPAPRNLSPGAGGAPGGDSLADARMADAIASVDAQVAALRLALAAAGLHDVLVEGLLCPGGKSLAAAPRAGSGASDIRVVSRADLIGLVGVAGPLTHEDRVTLMELLKTHLTPSR